MAEPADMIIQMLRDMRAENAALRQQTRDLIQADKRLGAIEEAQRSYRIEALERKVDELETQK